MRSLFYIIIFIISFSYANQGQASSTPASFTEQEKKIFGNSAISGAGCEFRCREVSSGYATQITGFDFTNGTTYCAVYTENNLEENLRFSANYVATGCKKEYNDYIQKAILSNTQGSQSASDIEVKSQIKQSPSSTDITFSRFMSAIVTLDPEIINRDETEATGELIIQDGITLKSSVSGLYGYNDTFASLFENGYIVDGVDSYINSLKSFFGVDKNPQPVSSGVNISHADGFNKANLAFFSNLFKNMQDVYTHLQMLLFTVVGAFYIFTIGSQKIQVYLENKGEYQGSSQPYLHKFFIPILGVAFFFAPIPDSAGVNSTIMQNIIRYFTAEATTIADIASAKGAETYLNKIYASTGGIDEKGKIMFVQKKAEAEFTRAKAIEVYNRTCNVRYTNEMAEAGIPFADMTEEQIKEFFEKFDIEQVAGGKNDISFQACIALQNLIYENKRTIEQADATLKGINNFRTNENIQKNLERMDKYYAQREEQLGWINSALVSSSSVLAEVQSYIKDAQYQAGVEETASKQVEATRDNINKGVVDFGDNMEGLSHKAFGYFMGNTIYFLLPGASSLYTWLRDSINKDGSLFASLLSLFLADGTLNSGLVITGYFLKSGTLQAWLATAGAYSKIIEFIPALVATIAGVVAISAYLVSLCKYFYISPFVVAFALTMKRTDKIIDFLLTGISIFFRPILIVLFIYLSLFLSVFINEFFILMSVEQFSVFSVTENDSKTMFLIESARALLKLLGSIASAYIIWKLIMNGPEWAMDLVGLKANHDQVVSASLSQKLEHRAFVA